MKIEKNELAKKIGQLKSIVPTRTTIDALKGVLYKDGYLIASDTELTVKAKIEGAEGESFLIPERAFDLINNLPNGEVEISATAENMIVIKADKIKNKYKTLDSAMFPTTAVPEDGSELTIPSDTLLESMKRVSYAVPAQNPNAVMTAMCLQASGGQLNFVGLDGHVLAWDKVDYDGEFELLIPKNTIEKLKLLGLSGDVKIKYNKIGAVFITEEFEVYTRIIDGKYFNYQRIFTDLPLHTVVSRVDLLEAMTRAKMCTEEKCPVKFEMEGSVLNLSIKDTVTDYHEIVDLQEEIGRALTIGFNARLVIETLKAFDCDNVGISFDGPKMPMIIEAEDSDFKTIVLPVAIN